MILFSGSSNPSLAASIAAHGQHRLGQAIQTGFPDGEYKFEIISDVHQQAVGIIQTTSKPADKHILELIFCAKALYRAGAGEVVAILPYFGFARQKLALEAICGMLVSAGIKQIVSVDLHTVPPPVPGLTIHNIPTTDLFLADLAQRDIYNPIIVSPDIGGATRAQQMAHAINADLAIINKLRSASAVNALDVIGNVAQRNCVIVDDIVDTGGTICSAVQKLKAHGAAKIIIYCTHAVLSQNAVQRLLEIECEQIVVTDTILQTQALPTKFKQLSSALLLNSHPITQCLYPPPVKDAAF